MSKTAGCGQTAATSCSGGESSIGSGLEELVQGPFQLQLPGASCSTSPMTVSRHAWTPSNTSNSYGPVRPQPEALDRLKNPQNESSGRYGKRARDGRPKRLLPRAWASDDHCAGDPIQCGARKNLGSPRFRRLLPYCFVLYLRLRAGRL